MSTETKLKIVTTKKTKPLKTVTITAKVRLEDADQLRCHASTFGVPIEVVAEVAAELGESAIRDNRVAVATEFEALSLLWVAINRDAAEFTEEIDLFKCPANLYQDKFDVRALSRTMADWQGTLIHVGLRVMAANPAFHLISHRDPLEVYCRSVAYHRMS